MSGISIVRTSMAWTFSADLLRPDLHGVDLRRHGPPWHGPPLQGPSCLSLPSNPSRRHPSLFSVSVPDQPSRLVPTTASFQLQRLVPELSDATVPVHHRRLKPAGPSAVAPDRLGLHLQSTTPPVTLRLFPIQEERSSSRSLFLAIAVRRRRSRSFRRCFASDPAQDRQIPPPPPWIPHPQTSCRSPEPSAPPLPFFLSKRGGRSLCLKSFDATALTPAVLTEPAHSFFSSEAQPPIQRHAKPSSQTGLLSPHRARPRPEVISPAPVAVGLVLVLALFVSSGWFR
ncbi:uncharacterized protein LOC125506978 [Triticum urartu]|uniref:uncharacterized protein LOC125506978 n=1 Tax=Triticum urartu TaxID=4572 RepID=UPI002043E0BE|nr:uncharacterized protein LOC125506978 [Triticum urartu]